MSDKITSDLLIVDLQDLNQSNFETKIKKLQKKMVWLLDNDANSQITSRSSADEHLIGYFIKKNPFSVSYKMLVDRSIFFEDSYIVSSGEKVHVNYLKKQPVQYRMLPNKCRLYLSNLTITNNEYILINANNHLHLFDRNLKLIRSNNDIKMNEHNLKDLSWCSDINSFIILTTKQVYLMNPLTCKLSIIENMKLNDRREEFISCSCSEEKILVITCQLSSKTFYYQEYSLPTFRFLKKLRILDFVGTSLHIQNGIFNKCDIQQILSIRYFQQKIAIIMEIASNWFIYVFNLYEQPNYLTAIHLQGKSRMTILNPMNQWIIFKDYLSNSFIQMSIDFQKKFEMNQQHELSDYTKGFIDFGGQLRSVALFGTSNLVLLIDNALVLYKL